MIPFRDGQYGNRLEDIMKVLGGWLGRGQEIMKNLIENAILVSIGLYLTQFSLSLHAVPFTNQKQDAANVSSQRLRGVTDGLLSLS